MKFFGKGIVWDKERERPLCRFTDGALETEDERVIEILKAVGYEHEAVDDGAGRNRRRSKQQ